MIDLEAIRWKIQKVDVNTVKVDLSYERDPSRNLVDRIMGDFHPVAAGILLVSNRGPRSGNGKVEGGLFLVDGQHRCLAARGLGVKTMEARVVDLTDHPDPGAVEALLRLHANVGLVDRALERFKAQVRSGDEESRTIQKTLARYGTQINGAVNADTGINCVAAIETLYRYDGGVMLQFTLEVMRDVYGEIGGQTAQANLFKGVFWFLTAHDGHYDRDRLVEKMKETQVPALMGKAKYHASMMTGPLWFNTYRALVELYNEKLHGKKLEWVTKGAARVNTSTRYKG